MLGGNAGNLALVGALFQIAVSMLQIRDRTASRENPNDEDNAVA